MSVSVLLLAFLASFLAAWCCTPIAGRLAKRKNWVDLPGGSRSMHFNPIPRAGGLAVIFAFFLGIGALYLGGIKGWTLFDTGWEVSAFAFPMGCVVMALVGLYDDAYCLGFKRKFLFQFLVAYVMFLGGFRIAVPNLFGFEFDPFLQAAFGLPLTIFWYLWVMNAVNLIDGLDGLASGVALISFFFLALVSGLNGSFMMWPVAIVIIGALFGFLLHNFNPASIFLGDTGSLFIGFLLATASIQGTGHSEWALNAVLAILIVGFPLLDTTVAVLRRLLNGQSPFAPDKDHIHHRLTVRFNHSVKGAVLRLYILNILLGITAVLVVMIDESYTLYILAGAGLLLTTGLKKLGYLHVRDIIPVLRKWIVAMQAKPVPRGEWKENFEDHMTRIKSESRKAATSLNPGNHDKREIIARPVE